MQQITSSTSLQAQSKTWRDVLRVLLGFIILYIVIWLIRVIMGVGPNLLLKWLGASPNIRAYVGSTLNYGVGIASYIILPAIAMRRVLKINPWDTLFPFHKTWRKDLLYGFLLVLGVLLAFFLAEVKVGWLIVNGWNWQTFPADAFLRTLWVGLLVNVGAAIGEETIFRGYLLTGLESALGKWYAIILMMIIFGLFHLPAYRASGGMHSWTLALAILLATLFGGLFGLVYLRTKSLWLPISLHFTWNFIENDVLNLTADSTNPNLIGALTRLHPPLTAGNFILLEGLAFLIIALGIWLWFRNAQRDNLTSSK